MSEHAIYSPSSCYRNLSCKGSIALISRLRKSGKLEEKESVYALEGTIAHDWANKALTAIHSQIHFDFDIIPDEEMRMHVQNYCAFIGELNTKFRIACEGVKYYIEEKVIYDDTFWGTADYVLTGFHKKSKAPFAVIADLKYGRGVEVEAEDNEQILCYALCLQKKLNRRFEMVHSFIYQPRTPGKEYTRWSIDADILNKSEDAIIANKQECLEILNNQDEPLPEQLCAGSWCRFCAAKTNGYCPEFRKDLNSTALKVLDEVPEIPTIESITIEQKVEIFKRRKMIKKFIDDICSDLLVTATKGEKVPGHKIVSGTRRRKWVQGDLASIGTQLKELGVLYPFKESLIGIGEVEKQVGKGKIDDLTELSKPTYQLVPDDDKRMEVQSIAIEDLGEVEFDE